MAAKQVTETVEESAVDDSAVEHSAVVESVPAKEMAGKEHTANDVSSQWAKAMLQAVTDAARDPLRYVTSAIVPDGGE